MSYYGLAPRRDENPEVILPDAAVATGIAVGVNWAWGAWAQVTVGEAYPFVLYGMQISSPVSIPAGVSFVQGTQVQVGIGAVGFETPVAESSFGVEGMGATTGNIMCSTGFSLCLAPILIPASTRIAVRMSTGLATGRMYPAVYLVGYDANSYSPVHDFTLKRGERMLKGVRVQAQGSSSSPSLGYVSPLLGNPAWTYGAWAQAIAAAANDLLVRGLFFISPSRSINAQIKVGIGSAGNEIVVAKVGCPARSIYAIGNGVSELPRPLYVRQGERVSLQVAGSTTGQAYDCQVLAQEVL